MILKYRHGVYLVINLDSDYKLSISKIYLEWKNPIDVTLWKKKLTSSLINQSI